MSYTTKRFYPFEETELISNPLKKPKIHCTNVNTIVNKEPITMSKKSSVPLEMPQTSKQNALPPLSERMKPTNLVSYVGQKHIIGTNTILSCLLETQVPSMILWGPPGCGKTSLVNIIIQLTKEKLQDKVHVVKLIATASGVEEVRKAVVKAEDLSKRGHLTIVYMNEIHRFNKLQQDIFLPHIENGTFILIGETIENPSYSLNTALLSRCRIFALNKLSVSDINEILDKGIRYMNGRVHNWENCNTSKFVIHNDTVERLAEICDGDARIALDGLELAVCAKNISYGSQPTISMEDIKQGLMRTHMLGEKTHKQVHHLYSALHKSVCAGKANAALYWLARIMAAKEDPVDIARRLVRISSEDIGLADPDALGTAVHTLSGCQMIGMPECDVILAQCVVYLTRAPKSRAIFNALKAAQKVINDTTGPQPGIPLHVKCKSVEGRSRNALLRRGESNKSNLPERLRHHDFFHED